MSLGRIESASESRLIGVSGISRRALVATGVMALCARADERANGKQEEEQRVNQRFSDTVARAIALIDAAKGLSDRLRRSGLTIRSDISASVRLIESELDQAESELKRG